MPTIGAQDLLRAGLNFWKTPPPTPQEVPAHFRAVVAEEEPPSLFRSIGRSYSVKEELCCKCFPI